MKYRNSLLHIAIRTFFWTIGGFLFIIKVMFGLTIGDQEFKIACGVGAALAIVHVIEQILKKKNLNTE